MLGEGWHDAYGGPHAEVAAIAACGDADLRGATLYVSLEPCCHHGQDAAVHRRDPRGRASRRVVVASDDPTEKASGRGLGILRDEGVEVVVADGELAARARLLNQAFRKHARTGRPWVLFKSAMTLDGKVATRTGDSKWISGEDSRARSRTTGAPSVDAVVGRHRHRAGRRPAADRARSTASHRQPRRVVFDSEARLPLDSQLVARRARGAARPSSSRAPRRARATDALEAAGAEVIVATGRERARARALGARPARRRPGVTSILLEGGPHLAGAFLDAGEIDEMRLFLAPLVLGGAHRARPARGRGRRADRRGAARADARRASAIGERRADHRAAAGVVSACSPGLVADLGTRRRASTRPATACACASRTRARRRARRGRLGRGQRRLPDRHGDRRRRASAPT